MAVPQIPAEWLELFARMGGGPQRAMGAMPLTGDLAVPGATSAFFDQEMLQAQQAQAMQALLAQLTAQPAEEEIFAGGDMFAGIPKRERAGARRLVEGAAPPTGPGGRPSRGTQAQSAVQRSEDRRRAEARAASIRPRPKTGRERTGLPWRGDMADVFGSGTVGMLGQGLSDEEIRRRLGAWGLGTGSEFEWLWGFGR